jgi:hypothetical protein
MYPEVEFVRWVLEMDSEEEVDHLSSVGCEWEAEECVLHGCVICAELDGSQVGFVEGVVEVGLEANRGFLAEDVEGLDAGALRSPPGSLTGLTVGISPWHASHCDSEICRVLW